MVTDLWILITIAACFFVIASSSARDTTLHFYMHDNVLPPNKTVLMVAGAGANSSIPGFGTVAVIDDAITEGPELNSQPLGRGQGTWIVAQLDSFSLLLTFSAVFQSGEFNGSTLSFHGADAIFHPVREIAVVGGTGAFRFARGYAEIRTHSFTPESVILSIDVKVRHD